MVTKVITVEAKEVVGDITEVPAIADIPTFTQTLTITPTTITADIVATNVSVDTVVPVITTELPLISEAIAEVTNRDTILDIVVPSLDIPYDLPSLSFSSILPNLTVDVTQIPIIASEDILAIPLSLPTTSVLDISLPIIDYSVNLINYGLIYPFDILLSPLNLHEYYHVTDNLKTSVSKKLQDTFTMSDSFNFLNTLGMTTLVDGSSMSDILSKQVSKRLSSQSTLSDITIRAVGKILRESFSTSDRISFVLQLPRSLVDTFTRSDTLKIALGKPLVDILSIKTADTVRLSSNKVNKDNVTIIETFSLRMDLPRFYYDFLSINEYLAISVGTKLTDQVSTSEYGFISIQGYCSEDYFAEDYVGLYTTF